MICTQVERAGGGKADGVTTEAVWRRVEMGVMVAFTAGCGASLGLVRAAASAGHGAVCGVSGPARTRSRTHARVGSSVTMQMWGRGGGKPGPIDRVLGTLPYLVPLLDSLVYGKYVFEKVPYSTVVLGPLVPLLEVYRGTPFLAFGIFLALFILVVRNQNVPRFIRFNTQQAILLDILTIIPNLFNGLGSRAPAVIVEGVNNTVFYGLVACVIYATISNLQGEYPDKIPGISDSVSQQIGPF
ncbi:Tic20 family protein [Porphyridium purpureum]|uniref:Tic20 family protein Ycf60 n=1 Tax=Porphyridium purpureum TaxID=35688 RepID=A0A5J4YJ87_PORPP|nr:Tic20 family protein [Porphyridium purpureum]|eukprot:POR6736..scf237_24